MTIHHIVLLKFKQGITPAEIEKVRTNLYELPSKISAISSAQVGRKIKNTLDQDFDEGAIFVFKDQEALLEYRPHPAHRAYQDLIEPYTQDKLIFDIHVED